MLTSRWMVLYIALAAAGCATTHASHDPMGQIRTEPTSCAAAKSADTTAYESTQLSEQPVPRSVPELVYPAEAKEKKIQGRVLVSAVVNADGTVDSASVAVTMRVHKLLDDEAQRVVSHATFWPGCRDGLAVRTQLTFPFDFHAKSGNAGVVFGVLVGVWAGVMAVMMD